MTCNKKGEPLIHMNFGFSSCTVWTNVTHNFCKSVVLLALSLIAYCPTIYYGPYHCEASIPCVKNTMPRILFF